MRAVLTVMMGLSLLLAACAGRQQLPVSDVIYFEPLETIVLPGDILHLTLKFYPDFNQSMIVNPEGNIHVQGLGELHVQNKTIPEIRGLLLRHFSEMLVLPELELTIQESLDLSFYITGAIMHPGKIQFRKNLSISQGIALAGGLKSNEKQYDVVIFRKSGNSGVQMFKIKLPAAPDTPQSNFQLQPFDMIIVMQHMMVKKKLQTI
jgi:polysaccharide export outer membrane protein